MDGTIAFALRPGDQAVFDIIIDHSGGEGAALVKTDELAGHIGHQLVHIQSKIGQVLPGGGPFLFHAGAQFNKLVHLSDLLSLCDIGNYITEFLKL